METNALSLVYTNLIVILCLLIMKKQLQALFPDLWLDMAATTVTFLWLLILTFSTIILRRFIRFAYHFCFAVAPDNSHSCFGIANVTDFVRKIGVHLTKRKQQIQWR